MKTIFTYPKTTPPPPKKTSSVDIYIDKLSNHRPPPPPLDYHRKYIGPVVPPTIGFGCGYILSFTQCTIELFPSVVRLATGIPNYSILGVDFFGQAVVLHILQMKIYRIYTWTPWKVWPKFNSSWMQYIYHLKNMIF